MHASAIVVAQKKSVYSPDTVETACTCDNAHLARQSTTSSLLLQMALDDLDSVQRLLVLLLGGHGSFFFFIPASPLSNECGDSEMIDSAQEVVKLEKMRKWGNGCSPIHFYFRLFDSCVCGSRGLRLTSGSVIFCQRIFAAGVAGQSNNDKKHTRSKADYLRIKSPVQLCYAKASFSNCGAFPRSPNPFKGRSFLLIRGCL